jgi:hypothetical protein
MSSLSSKLLALSFMLLSFAPLHLRAQAAELATLTNGSGGSNNDFGFAVAISGDTVAVGAPSASSGKGAVYVFVKPVGGWTTSQTPAATLTDGSLNANSDFGAAVAIDGDTILVGAPGARVSNHTGQGQAAVFVRPAGGWADSSDPTARLTEAAGAAQDQFGFSVALSGNVAVVGSPGADKKKGAVHVFTRPGGGWNTTETPNATLTDNDGANNDRLGFSVAISGDTVVTGAYARRVNNKSKQGAAYVFVRGGGGWINDDTPTAVLTASDGDKSDQFGISVAIDAGTVIVGAWTKDIEGNSEQGAAYLFLKPGGGWTSMTESALLLSSDGESGDAFGVWVDVAGNNVIIGASFHDVDTRNEGAVYLFSRPAVGWTSMTETLKLTASQLGRDDSLGFAVALSGEVVVAGAPNAAVGGNASQGSALLFSISDPPPAVGALLPPAEIGAMYEADIAISGGEPPYSVSDAGSLPPGLSVNNAGVVTGTPAADAKTKSVTFAITDQNGAGATKTVDLKILPSVAVTTKSLPGGKVGKKYRGSLKAKSGKGPYTWSLASGALPAGLIIDNDIDAISGVPVTAAGSPFTFVIRVTDALGGVATQALSISVSP